MVANLPAAPAYSGTSAFAHNATSQLTQETSTRAGGYTNTFAYDNNYNATTFRGAARTFNTANELNGITYDGDGNPTTWNSNALTFDANSQLNTIGTVLSASYDETGRRVWKQGTSGRTYFLYDVDGTIPLCELDGSGNVIAYNTFTEESLLARHVNGTGGGSVFYAFDPQGNTAQRIDPGGNVLASTMSDAFGNTLTNATVGDPYNGFGAQWGYYHDGETGLYLLGQRYYDAAIGRFLNRDPAYAGPNWYAYASNNPLANNDPTGLLDWPCWRKWIGTGLKGAGSVIAIGIGIGTIETPVVGVPLIGGGVITIGDIIKDGDPCASNGGGNTGTPPSRGPGTPPGAGPQIPQIPQIPQTPQSPGGGCIINITINIPVTIN